jgi:hypothetical protein
MWQYQVDSGSVSGYTTTDAIDIIHLAVARETDINLDDDSFLNRSWNESHGSQVVPDAMRSGGIAPGERC